MRLLAESMHQRWLSDSSFSTAAARLAFQVCAHLLKYIYIYIYVQLSDLSVNDGDVRFGSILYALLMNDYRDRNKFRQSSPNVLCNSAQFAFSFYQVFRSANAFYANMIDPLLDYLVNIHHCVTNTHPHNTGHVTRRRCNGQ
jgi:hypothetical protein